MAWQTSSNCTRYFTLMSNGQFHASTTKYAPEWAAAKVGDVDTIDRLFAHPYFGQLFSGSVANVAATFGQLDVLKFLFENCSSVFNEVSVLKEAVEQGHIEVAQWLVANTRSTLDAPVDHAAVKSGKLFVLQWALQSTNRTNETDDAIAFAATHGTSFEVYEWLVEERRLVLSPSHSNIATRRHDTELTKWIVRKCQANGTFFGGENVLTAAIAMGNLDLVRWYVEEIHLWSPNALQLACLGQNVEVLAFIWDRASTRHEPSDVWFGRTCVPPNRINTFVWLLRQGLVPRFLPRESPYGIVALEKNYARRQRELRAPLWSPITESPTTLIHRLRDAFYFMAETYDAEYIRQNEWLPKWAARRGQLSVLKRLATLHSHEEFFTRRLFDSLLYESGSQDVVQWLLEQAPTLFSTRVIQWAVTHGKRTLFQWLFQRFLPDHVERQNDQQLFRKCISTATHTAIRHGRKDFLHVLEECTEVQSATCES